MSHGELTELLESYELVELFMRDNINCADTIEEVEDQVDNLFTTFEAQDEIRARIQLWERVNI